MLKNDKQTKRANITITIILFSIAITMLFPFLWMISASLKTEPEVFQYPIKWIPKKFQFINYKKVWEPQYMFGLMYLNTVKVSVITTLLDIFICTSAAYSFTKIQYRFKNQVLLLFLMCWMIPGQVTMIPKFIIFTKAHLYNTHTGLILSGLFSAYGIFLIKQFMESIPDTLCESAKIDGANHFIIFRKIILPMTQPAIVTLAILRFVWTWNNYQGALVYLQSKDKFTIQRGLTQFQDPTVGVTYSLLMAASVCAIIPLVIVFFVLQKSIIEGIANGAVKG